MSVREYVGARYVPLFADPLTWDATRTYEPLTVVLYQGNSYTSRQAVPANIDITNTTYWAQTGNYNAQIEQYRAEVQTFDSRIEANADAISDEETARQNADTALQTAINNEATARQTAINNEATARQTAITNETAAREAADALLATKTELQNAVSDLASKTYVDNAIDTIIDGDLLLFGDSWTDRAQGFPDWVPYVTEELHYNNIRNYAVGGAGWITGTTIQTQISNANSQLTTQQKNDVKTVIVFAGVNDLDSITSDSAYVTARNSIETAMRNCYRSLTSTYKRAKIYFIPTVCGYTYTNERGFEYCGMFNKWVKSGTNEWGNIPYNSDFFDIYLMYNDSAMYGNGRLHLNEAGARYVGVRIREMLKGNMSEKSLTVRGSLTSGNHSLEMFTKYCSDHVSVTGIFTGNNPSAGSIAFNINKDYNIAKAIAYTLLATDEIAEMGGMLAPMVTDRGIAKGYIRLRPGTAFNRILVSATEAATGTQTWYGCVSV